MDDDELSQLRSDQDDVLADLAHSYPSVAELVASSLDVGAIYDPEREHELACRLIADEFFERHRDHLEALASHHLLDLVTTVADELTGAAPADAVRASLLETTVPSLRAQVVDLDDEDGTRERELRDAAALVLAANGLQRVALER